MMLLPIIVASGISVLFVDHALNKPPKKSPERALGEALAKYLASTKSSNK